MHPNLVEQIVKTCRQREIDGDCPTVERHGSEMMEFCIIELARERDHLLALLKQVDNRFEPWGEKLHAEIKSVL